MLDCNAILPSNGICNHQHDASLCALSLGHLDQCHKCFSQPSRYILCMLFLRCTFSMCNSSSPHVTNAKNVFPKQVSSKRTSKSASFVLLPINFMSIKSFLQVTFYFLLKIHSNAHYAVGFSAPNRNPCLQLIPKKNIPSY